MSRLSVEIFVVFEMGVTIQYKLAKLRSRPSASGSRQNCQNINITLSLLVTPLFEGGSGTLRRLLSCPTASRRC